jgi:hypothetical protein
MKSRAVVLLAVALGFGVVACGDDGSPSAPDQVCEARSSLQQAIDSVREDLGDGDFGDARDGLSEVTDALGDLREAGSELGAEQREALEPQIDELTDTISGLTDVESLDELGDEVGSIGDQIGSIFGEISDAVSC